MNQFFHGVKCVRALWSSFGLFVGKALSPIDCCYEGDGTGEADKQKDPESVWAIWGPAQPGVLTESQCVEDFSCRC